MKAIEMVIKTAMTRSRRVIGALFRRCERISW